MLLDNLILIIIDGRAGHNAGLGTSIHRQLIDIVAGSFFYNKGTVCNHGIQSFFRFLINSWVVGVYMIGKLGFSPIYL